MELCARFATLLDYPGPELPQAAGDCAAALEPVDLESAALVREFARFAASSRPASLEETYTASFDMRAQSCLYAGWHLFGDDLRRGLFLAGLNREYRRRGFSRGCDLPDHLPVLLRYLARRRGTDQEHPGGDGADTRELVEECLLPAVRAITMDLEKSASGYLSLLRALERVLERMLPPARVLSADEEGFPRSAGGAS